MYGCTWSREGERVKIECVSALNSSLCVGIGQGEALYWGFWPLQTWWCSKISQKMYSLATVSKSYFSYVCKSIHFLVLALYLWKALCVWVLKAISLLCCLIEEEIKAMVIPICWLVCVCVCVCVGNLYSLNSSRVCILSRPSGLYKPSGASFACVCVSESVCWAYIEAVCISFFHPHILLKKGLPTP